MKTIGLVGLFLACFACGGLASAPLDTQDIRTATAPSDDVDASADAAPSDDVDGSEAGQAGMGSDAVCCNGLDYPPFHVWTEAACKCWR